MTSRDPLARISVTPSMMLSIITPCYNSSNYLRDALDSVLSQDYPDIEYIIIDGGSTDGTLDIIREYADRDQRIRWISEPDDGISDAFNKGIRMATGDIIGILNSDDRYAPGALEKVAEAVAAHPECDVFHGDMLRSQGDTPLFMLKPSDVERNIWREMPLNHPATFVSKRAYAMVGPFDTGLKVAMDYDMILRIYIAGFRFHYIDAVLADMRYGGVSDERFAAARREVLAITLREGYPPLKAYAWFVYKIGMNSIKMILRRLGLHSLMRLHPKFKEYRGQTPQG